jgi:PAS domain-containing protein
MEGHQEIEVILVRQLAGYLALPVVILDPQGTVIYYNEPAERILARRFDEGGPIPPTHWAADFEFAYESGEPLPLEEMTLVAALRTRELVHMNFRLRGLDKVRHHVASAGIPLIGNAGRFLGVAAFFFELDT